MIWELAEGWIFGAFSILCSSDQEPLPCAHCVCLPVAPLLAAMEIFSLCRQKANMLRVRYMVFSED